MKKFLSKTAVTLIELIVSITLVSIVLLGIFAVNTVLRNNNQDYGQRYLVRSQTQATLNHILNNAALAVGSGTNITLSDNSSVPDQGILIGNSGMGDANSFCIHQGAYNNIIQSPNAGYDTDIWLCYTWSNYQINYCTMSYTNNPPYRGAASCPANAPFLGTAYTNPSVSFTNNVFTVTIQNNLNDSAPADPVNNPQVQVSGSAFPSQEGSG